MKRKYFILLLLLFIISALAACRPSKDEDLFKQRTEGGSLAQTEGAVNTSQEEKEQKLLETSECQAVNNEQATEERQTTQTEQVAEERQIAITEQGSDGQKESSREALGENMINSFYYEELTDEIKERINGRSYGKNCDVPYEDLRYVKVLHYGFDGEVHEGELIVNKAIAQDTIDIFQELYEAKYKIERMVLVDEYDADDNTSMAANNSSAFNYRVIDGTNRISLHSYGMAIDINPLYNPYVHTVDGETVVTPVSGAKYEDRTLACEYYINKEDVCYKAFTKRGFTWGGDWTNLKDYQHFQKTLDK